MNQGRLAAYAAGNKVYGAGRPHPTSGPVDPTGYIERSVNKGASNRRSGLAAAAGRRLAAKQTPSQQTQQVQPMGNAAPPSAASPIILPDGRKVAPNATGQFEWVTEPGDHLEGNNGV